MRIIVTGGTGLIGRPLSQALVGDGHEVIVLTRTPAKVTNMPAGVKLQQWDGVSAQGWGEQVDGAGAIINLAGEGIADGRWSTARKKSIRESRLTAGKAIMAAINCGNQQAKGADPGLGCGLLRRRDRRHAGQRNGFARQRLFVQGLFRLGEFDGRSRIGWASGGPSCGPASC